MYITKKGPYAFGPFQHLADAERCGSSVLPLLAPQPLHAAVLVRRTEGGGVCYYTEDDRWVLDPVLANHNPNYSDLVRLSTAEVDGAAYSIEARVVFDPRNPADDHLRDLVKILEQDVQTFPLQNWRAGLDWQVIPDSLASDLLHLVCESLERGVVSGVVFSAVRHYVAALPPRYEDRTE